MSEIFIYVHGKSGSAEEAEHYRKLFPDCCVIGFDYHSETPWEACNEFPAFFAEQHKTHEHLSLIANSIGAFFAMSSLDETLIDSAYLISPVVNMEKLILQMMDWSNITESELYEKQVINTDYGETLSWKYLCYVRRNQISWNVPTSILYGEHDNLTPMGTISEFAKIHNATLTIMPNGEHWFHTDEEMHFLDNWLKKEMQERKQKTPEQSNSSVMGATY